jgi:adenosylhomocysteine nucleosidase
MLAAVTGLAAEARILRRAGIIAEPCGGDPRRAAETAARLLAAGATRLLSFGIAGALAPGLATGAVLLPRRVVTEAGERFGVDTTLRDAIAQRLAMLGVSFDERDILGRDTIAASADDKLSLHRNTGAAAVDLESHAAARAARNAGAPDAGAPFAVLRAVADPAHLALPPAALVGLDGEGNAALLPVLRALLRAPAQLPALVSLALQTRAALRTLSRTAAALPGSG